VKDCGNTPEKMLLSGPFKKVFQRPTVIVQSQRPAVQSQGPVSSNQADEDPRSWARSAGFPLLGKSCFKGRD
jgi:hypothetical protein